MRRNVGNIRFDTSGTSPDDRFEQWREVRGRYLFGVTLELERERRAAFSGSFSAWTVGGARVSDLRASAYVVKRTESDIARVAGNSLAIGYQLRGPGLLDSGRDRIGMVRNGDMIIAHSDHPYAATPSSASEFHYRMINIPLHGEPALGDTGQGLFAEKLADSFRFKAPLQALFNALTTGSDGLVDPALQVTHITRLALAARGRLAPGQPEVRAAIRAGLFQTALATMEREKGQADLSPALVAARLGISRRQLYVLFEGSEQTFSRALATIRIREARRLLLAHPDRSVAQIAYACGFDSLATFYRIFGATYGVAPKELRLVERGRRDLPPHEAVA